MWVIVLCDAVNISEVVRLQLIAVCRTYVTYVQMLFIIIRHALS